MPKLNKYDLKFCVKRLPAALRDLLKKEDITVAGGFIRAAIAAEKVNDVDLFISDKSKVDKWALSLADDERKNLYITDNATTVKNLSHPVQFITRWVYEFPEDILESFDFTICQAAFWWDRTSESWKSACSVDFYPDLAAKRLTYTSPIREEEPGGSMIRILKYYQRGYKIPLNDLASVITRLHFGVRDPSVELERYQTVIRGLLYEVDPNADPDHIVQE